MLVQTFTRSVDEFDRERPGAQGRTHVFYTKQRVLYTVA